jgi:hypothetical protein
MKEPPYVVILVHFRTFDDLHLFQIYFRLSLHLYEN